MFNIRFIRFLFVGGVNTLFGYGVYSLLIFIGLHYSISLCVSTVAGVLFNFKTTGFFVFQNNDNSRIIRFIMVYAVLYVINIVLIALLKMLGANEYTAGAIIIFPSALLSFLLNSVFVFHKLRRENCD